ncbi:MAG: nickel pincer cofactor biosynthesis protein LarC [Termitinemataceae bacterium]|nr:MAG: nickel pincer cofactor biosynthesis protein LarC [Termitinemataceae bacterium]
MTLHFDCFAGISGDMTLGALVDLGVDPVALCGELKKLNIDGWLLEFSKDARCGITGTKAAVTDTTLQSRDDHESDQNDHQYVLGGIHHHHNDHVHYSEIRVLIEKSGITEGAKKIALDIFRRIAVAESEVHGVPLDDIAFHEVGAVDSIIDITGAAICLDILKPNKITASTIELGGGFVKCAHGTLPVPAPATLKLAAGLPVKTGGFDKEMTTPTGAAILASCVDQFVTGEYEFTELRSAYGIGHRKMEKPNVLRVSLREEIDHRQNNKSLSSEHQSNKSMIFEKLFLIETNIDDMSGEAFGFLMERLFDVGALDVTFTACVMKKSRPGTTVSVLGAAKNLDKLRTALFEHSTAIGFKETEVNRVSLPRTEKEVHGDFGSAKIKTVGVDNCTMRSKIEYEDRSRIAREKRITLFDAESLIRASL